MCVCVWGGGGGGGGGILYNIIYSLFIPKMLVPIPIAMARMITPINSIVLEFFLSIRQK